jgi:serine/threonine-protein kinase
LPFRALVAEPVDSDQALGLALSEALITRLGTATGIIVRPASAVRKYLDARVDPAAIGKALRVPAVIDGSFQEAGGRLRVTVQLLRTADGKHLWSGDFDEQRSDIFSLQDAIADRVARALMVHVTSAKQTRHLTRPEVFDLGSRGRYHLLRYSADDAAKALRHYQLAVEKDPAWAPAHAGMAWAYIQHSEFRLLPYSVSWAKARDAAQRAVSLDDSSVEALVALGNVQFAFEWDWNGAQRNLQRACAIQPRDLEALGAYRNLLTAVGRLEESLELSYKIRALDRLSPQSSMAVVSSLVTLKRYDEAIAAARETLELQPEFPGTHAWLARAYHGKGMHDQWFLANSRASELAREPPEIRAKLRTAYKAGGVHGYWRATLELLRERSRSFPVSPIAFVETYAALGEDQAFRALERSYAEREPNLVHLKTSPTFEPLRSDPRYTALLKRMKLDDDSQRP